MAKIVIDMSLEGFIAGPHTTVQSCRSGGGAVSTYLTGISAASSLARAWKCCGDEPERSFTSLARIGLMPGPFAMSRSLAPICRLLAATLVWTGNIDLTAAAPKPAAGPDQPLAFCARVGTLDIPPGGGSPVPRALEPYVRTALRLSADSVFAPESYYWRCMNRAVFVCAIGANLPCASKADRSKRNAGAEQYCRDNRDASSVPAYATGHETIYDWRCVAGSAVRGKRTVRLDRQGYRTDIWHRIRPP